MRSFPRLLFLGSALLASSVLAKPAAAPRPDCGDHECTREELEVKERRLADHVLKVQRERFEAPDRGATPEDMKQIEKRFRRSQVRWRGALDALKEAQAAEN